METADPLHEEPEHSLMDGALTMGIDHGHHPFIYSMLRPANPSPACLTLAWPHPKVLLDAKDIVNTDTKLDTFSDVYKILTNKQVSFEFPVDE